MKGSIFIECEKVVKLLGIDIDYQLNFDKHINNLCRKASQQLAVLKRIGKHLCHLSKLTIFHTFILSHFNFCPLAWHFCNAGNTKKLEKVQERALRFIYYDYTSDYETLLEKAHVSSLHVKRLRTMALETFKIVNKLSPPILQDLVHKKDTKYNFRYSNILQVSSVRTTSYGKQSFKYAAAVLWNTLPEHFRVTNSFSHFKSLIQSWNGNECKCNACCDIWIMWYFLPVFQFHLCCLSFSVWTLLSYRHSNSATAAYVLICSFF